MKTGKAATDYYGQLFSDEGADEDERHRVQTVINCEYDASQAAQPARIYIDGEAVTEALSALRPGRTCGTDGIPSEAWQAASAAGPEMSAALAWAFNKSIAGDASSSLPMPRTCTRE